MPAIITQDIRIHNALQFKEALGEAANTSLYMFIGQPAFANANAAVDTQVNQYDIWDNMVTLKKINDGDAAVVVPRHNWVSGNTYAAYDANSNVVVDANFYALNSSFEVFKCLGNANGSPSTVEPQASLPATTGNTALLADGYRWKYLYTVSAPAAAKFLTTNFMPVSEDATVQSQAVDGGILHIDVVNGGSGYGAPPAITITGDGSGASATAVLTGNSITSVTVNNPGSGYRFATVSVASGNAVLRASISPAGGHGKDPTKELFGKYVMVNSRFEPTDPTIPVPLTYHQIGVVSDPKLYGSNNIAYGSGYRAYKTLTLNATAESLTQGTIINGSSSGANAYVLKGDGSNVLYIQTNDVSSNVESNFKSFEIGDGIAGVGLVTAVVPPEVQPDSGRIIYVDNKNPIIRNSEQTESVHIVLEF